MKYVLNIDRLNYHLEVKEPEDFLKMEVAFVKEIQERGADFKYYKDQYGEHPDERALKNEEITEKLESVVTLEDLIQATVKEVFSNEILKK